MKRKFIVPLIVVAVVAAVAAFNMTLASDSKEIALSLFGVEQAQAQDPYEVGPTGSNWQTYWQPCTRTGQHCYEICAEPAGVGACYTYCTSSSYVATVAMCGYGWGFCTSSAGC